MSRPLLVRLSPMPAFSNSSRGVLLDRSVRLDGVDGRDDDRIFGRRLERADSPVELGGRIAVDDVGEVVDRRGERGQRLGLSQAAAEKPGDAGAAANRARSHRRHSSTNVQSRSAAARYSPRRCGEPVRVGRVVLEREDGADERGRHADRLIGEPRQVVGGVSGCAGQLRDALQQRAQRRRRPRHEFGDVLVVACRRQSSPAGGG